MKFAGTPNTEVYINPHGQLVIKQDGGYAEPDQMVIIPKALAKILTVRIRELIKSGDLVDFQESEDA